MSDNQEITDGTPLQDRLRRLAQGEGLRRSGLAQDLGPGLRRLWGISLSDAPKKVQDVTIDKFRQAIDKLEGNKDSDASEVRRIACISYNPEGNVDGDLTARRTWLVKFGGGPTITVSKSRTRMRDTIAPQLEKLFLADWERFASGEPFPGTQEVTPGTVTSPSLPLGTSLSAWVVMAVTAVGIIVAASILIPNDLGQTDQRPPASPTIEPGAAGSTSTSAPTPTTFNPGQSQPDSQEDGFLRSTIIPIATNTDLSFAFPAKLEGVAGQHIRRLDGQIKTIDLQQAYVEALNDGAYAAGGSTLIRMELEGLADGEVTITDVRLTEITREPIPLSSLVFMSFGGGDRPRELYYSLEQPIPVAMHEPPWVGASVKPFHEVERIGIPKGAKETLLLTFFVQTQAVRFNIAVDYEYRGKLYTQTLHRTKDGHPFAMAAIACAGGPLEGPVIGTQPDELDRVNTLRYRNVYRLNVGGGGDRSQFRLEPADSDNFAEHCS